MGDPKKVKKKYSTPTHPWQKIRIEEEIALKREFGLRNKREIWGMTSVLKNFKGQLKKLSAMSGAQAEKEKEQLRTKLLSLGLITSDSPLDSVLGLEAKDIMERRLQTVLFRKNLARSIDQARQFIVHRHVSVAGKKVTAPSYMVSVIEESQITFTNASPFSDPSHPERYEDSSKTKVQKKKEKKKEETEEIAAFEKVHADEEAIVKDIGKKEEPSEESQKTLEEASKKK